MRRTLSGLVVMCALCSASGDELDDLLAVFQSELGAITNKFVINEGLLKEKYLEALKALSEQKASKGDLDDFIALRQETERFQASEELTREQVVQEPVELRKMQGTYMKTRANLERVQARHVLELASKTEQQLAQAEQVFTRASKIERAVAVREERQKLSRLEVVEQARAVVPARPQQAGIPGVGFQPQTMVSETAGFAGVNNVNNIYEFKVDKPGRYSFLRYYASGDMNTKTYGFVVLTTPDGERHRLKKWNPDNFDRPVRALTTWQRLKPTTLNISKYVKKPGNYQVSFEHTQGIAGLGILRVEFELR
ncbi:MAG: hypothetical protein VCG02_15530 [Verrucomicrobiota bacterium]